MLTMLLIGLPLFVNSEFADVAIKAKEEVEKGLTKHGPMVARALREPGVSLKAFRSA